MNSTLSVTITTTPTNIPPLANAQDDMSYSSFTIGIIVLCVASSLLMVLLCIFLYIKRRRSSNASLNTEKQQEERSGRRLWSIATLLKSSTSVESMDSTSIHHDNNTFKIKCVSLSAAILPSRKKKTVLVRKAASTMLDDIPLPPPTTASLPAPLPAASTVSKRHNGQCMEESSPIVFEEGYDPKALLSAPYYYYQHRCHHHHSGQYRQPGSPSCQHPTEEHHQLPATSLCVMASPPPNNGSFSSVDDPRILESLERQKHINDIYYRTSTTSASTSTATFHCHHRPSPSWSSSTIIQQPCMNGKCNNNSSLLSLSMAEKLEQDAELQLKIVNYENHFKSRFMQDPTTEHRLLASICYAFSSFVLEQ
ncbi:hypothetical protein BCR42DRAFT_398420 [Absidia repens]|uniref:Uncharacterized protein n=1 Tax=Absidia repens TaxID=90262 RepID=A0A1X2HY16_9FUNG|nr:hypothetical protein BCR42DRAFT_398420 [Absidia repens]